MSASELPDVGDREAVARSLRDAYFNEGLSDHRISKGWTDSAELVQRLVADAVAKANATLDALRAERDAATRRAEEARGLLADARLAVAEMARCYDNGPFQAMSMRIDAFLRATDAGGKSNTGASEGGSNG